MNHQVDHWSREPDHARLAVAHDHIDRQPLEALAQLQELVNAGSVMSMIYIGNIYHKGKGTNKDLVQAESWYRRAAEAGSVIGLYALGRLYFEQKRYEEAWHKFRFAAAADYAPAIHYLGKMHFYGCGVPRAMAKAKAFLEVASAQRNVFATRLLGHLLIRTHLTAGELLRGMFLTARTYVDILVGLWLEGMSSERFQ